MSTTLDISTYFKSDVEVKNGFVNYSHTSDFDKETDKAASWRWENSERLETDEAFVQHQLNDYLLRYGLRDEAELAKLLEGVETVAEIGAGEGRAVDWYLKYSKAIVFALEISDSVYYLKEKYKNEPRVIVIKADALQHPFATDSIDFLSCEQSIHHAPNPREVFASLCEALSKKGQAIVSVYAKKSPIREKFDLLIRDTIAKLPNDQKLTIAERFTQIGKLLSELNVEIDVPKDAFEFGELAGRKMPIQRFFYYAIFKCFYNKDFTLKKSAEFTYDWYSYPVCNKTTIGELCEWFIENDLAIHHANSNDSNVNVRGQKK